MDTASLFLRETVIRLRQEYLPRIRAALENLTPEQIWWRPHDDTTSIGVLMRHLAGNVRQWILGGLDGQPDRRERPAEFDGAQHEDAAAVHAALESTVREACRVLDVFPGDQLTGTYRIQGIRTTALGAIYHVLEHFGWHTGQIVWMAKLARGAGHGIAFYDDDALHAGRGDTGAAAKAPDSDV